MPSTTSSPFQPCSSNAAGETSSRARASRRSARLLTMRSSTLPPVSPSRKSDSASAIVFTAFAPIALRTSTSRCAMTIGPRTVCRTRTSMSLAPPPTSLRTGSCSLAISRIRSRAWRMRARAASGSGAPTIWIWPIMIGSVEPAVIRPCSRTSLATWLAAATTEDSSTAIGMR